MRLFIYEYTCATGSLTPGLPSSLLREGWAMLRALVDDFSRISDLTVSTVLGNGFPHACPCDATPLCSAEQEQDLFSRMARQADFTLLLAPETDAILLSRTLWLETAGFAHLGCTSDAVRLTGDKWALAQHLKNHAIATPPTLLCSARSRFRRAKSRKQPDLDAVSGTLRCSSRLREFPSVLKPRYGAGSQATYLVHDPTEMAACLSSACDAGNHSEFITQPFVPGTAVSAAFLVGANHAVALAPCVQSLSSDGRFQYLGGSCPIDPTLADRATRLASKAISAVVGLRGYVGVDLVLGHDQDWVIEINPRLTTSYVGLQKLAIRNIALCWLDLIRGLPVAPIDWCKHPVKFSADGTVQ